MLDIKSSFKLDKVGKKLHIKGLGVVTPKEAEEFISEYSSITKLINTSEYELHFDCTELRIAGLDRETGVNMTEPLKDCLKMYKNNNFSNIIFYCSGNIPMSLQLKRLGKEVGLNKFEVLK